jgi:hypothetical protein
MKTTMRVILSIFVAIAVCAFVYAVALAATGNVSEQSGDFSSTGLNAASGCSSSTCVDRNAKYANQSTGSETAYGNWYTSTDNVFQWLTYIPNLSGDWAGVKYTISNSYPASEVYQTTVNQNNWKGYYVFIGDFDLNSVSVQMLLPNTCVAGFACDGRRLYYDNSQYTY